jgi:hypothetical protein
MKTVARNVVIALTLALSVVAFAQDAEPGSSSGSTMMPKNWDAQLYGDVGLHILSVSAFGVSASSTNFGLTLGGKFTYRLTDSLSVGPLANLSLVFGNGSTYVPLTAAGVVTFDKVLPVELTGGLGFTLVTGTGGGTTPAGLAILAQALYPLPSMPNLGIHAQLVENILNDGFNLFQLTAGVGYKF